ncbi:hypothetical protein DH2020_030287 [Rehmannia glutinosa]|uniref:Charged multivesicular body protein n=1 Tax=Rehmannia glutinosa TaxID=99300 RepID=A0ABR0VPP5_REHGL
MVRVSDLRNPRCYMLPLTIEINKRGETVDEKIKRLDAELARYKDQIKKTRPGPAQEAVKARAMRVLKQKRINLLHVNDCMGDLHFVPELESSNSYSKLNEVEGEECLSSLWETAFILLISYIIVMLKCPSTVLIKYEGQRDMLYNQTFNLDQVAFAAEGIKDAQQTMSALKSANKELKGMMKTVKIQDIDNLQDEMLDLMDVSNEIQESLGRSYNVPDDIDEDDLMGELDALEADMGFETEGDGVPSYLQPDKESDLDAELNLPSAPSGPAGRANMQGEDELGLPAVPRASLRG